MFVAAPEFPWLVNLAAVAVFAAALLFGLIRGRQRTIEPKTWNAQLAWLRAAAYFCLCFAISVGSGVLPTILASPLASDAQLANPLWIAMTVACTVVILVGYAVIWPIGTFNDGRKAHPLLTPLYGLVWGICQGLLFLSFWALAEKTGLGVWWVAGISYLLIGAYNGVWHHFFWDIYVSPPHNYKVWNGRKVLFAHTPNLLICLTYLALFGNAGIYVLLQALALGISAWVMRFPAPWDSYTATPHER